MKRIMVCHPSSPSPMDNNDTTTPDSMQTEDITLHQLFPAPSQLQLCHSMDIMEPMTMEIAHKRRRMDEIFLAMDISASSTPSTYTSTSSIEMEEATSMKDYPYLLDLPTEMLAHIFSFLPLKNLCHSAEICSATYSVVRFYTLSVALQVKCREFVDKNEKLVKDLIFAQHEHIEVLKKLVEFYRGEIPIPKTEVEKLQQRQAELHLKERTLVEQQDGIQRNIAFYSDQYKACVEVKQILSSSNVP